MTANLYRKPLCQLGNTPPLGRCRPKGAWLRNKWCLCPEEKASALYQGIGPVNRLQPGSKSLYRLNLALCPGHKLHYCAQCPHKNVTRPQKDGSMMCLGWREPRVASPVLTIGQRAMKLQGSMDFSFDISAGIMMAQQIEAIFLIPHHVNLPKAVILRESGTPTLIEIGLPGSLLRWNSVCLISCKGSKNQDVSHTPEFIFYTCHT